MIHMLQSRILNDKNVESVWGERGAGAIRGRRTRPSNIYSFLPQTAVNLTHTPPEKPTWTLCQRLSNTKKYTDTGINKALGETYET